MNKFLLFMALVVVVACKNNSNSMAGDYSVTQSGVTTTASIKVEGENISGLINIGGSPGIIAGKLNGNAASGIITSTEDKRNFNFTAILNSDTLKMIVLFPELNNNEITFNLKRIKTGEPISTNKKSENPGSEQKSEKREESTTEPSVNEAEPPKKENTETSSDIDPRLIGTWKNVEVISSGSGDSYGSFSTESFIEFKEDGTVYMWVGQSAGGGGGQSFEGNGNSQKQKGKWRTEGKMIVFIDPATGQEGKTKFMVDGTRMLLSDGGSNKKIFTRVE